MSAVLMAVWLCEVHLVASLGLLATFLIAVCTSVFYGVLLWTIYVALEPYVRKTVAAGARVVDERLSGTPARPCRRA